MVQGRYDIVCPPQTAYELHKAFPESRLFWIPDAGHSAMVRPPFRTEFKHSTTELTNQSVTRNPEPAAN